MEGEGFSRVPKNLQFRVGLLVGLTLMVAAGFIGYALYARGVFEATQRLTLIADNAEGVSIGMDLSFSGFPIGRVQRISLGEDGRARISIEIPREDAKWLRTSSIFTLERGIVGGARIRAFSGNLQDPPLPDGAERVVLRGDTQEEIPRMVATLRAVLENVEQVTGAFAVIPAVQMRGHLAGPAVAQLGAARFEGVTQQRRVVPVGRGTGDPERDAVAVHTGRTFHAAFATVDR